MKQFTSYILLLICTLQIQAQNSSSNDLVLQTNKTLYVSGDEVGFKCTLVKHKTLEKNSLYVDICGEGYTISSQILRAKNSHWEGNILLPDTLQTGVYLLRAYIGNPSGQPTISSKPISVFNRFGNNTVNIEKKIKQGYRSYKFPPSSLPAPSESLTVYAEKETFPVNASIRFSIENDLKKNKGGLSFLIHKACVDSALNATTSDSKYTEYTPSPEVKIYNYINLRGKVTHKPNGQPAINETILLSVPDSIPYINYSHTDSLGEYRFLLKDFYGDQNFVVQTMNKKQDFDLKVYPIMLLPPAQIPFYIDELMESGEFVQLAINRATLHKVYEQKKPLQNVKSSNKFPFYGISGLRIYPDRFVPLNDFEEIAWEILPIVKYRKEKDVISIKLWNPATKIFYGNPWILVDGIPVFDADKLRVLNSDKINWIELQPQIRCFGDLFIEGVLAIQTYKANFTDVELPANALRLELKTYFDNSHYSNAEQNLFRDVLYWNPNLGQDQKSYQIDVQSSFEKGKYIAKAQTIDEAGNIHQATFHFSVE